MSAPDEELPTPVLRLVKLVNGDEVIGPSGFAAEGSVLVVNDPFQIRDEVDPTSGQVVTLMIDYLPYSAEPKYSAFSSVSVVTTSRPSPEATSLYLASKAYHEAYVDKLNRESIIDSIRSLVKATKSAVYKQAEEGYNEMTGESLTPTHSGGETVH
jgi:hypothetical protein